MSDFAPVSTSHHRRGPERRLWITLVLAILLLAWTAGPVWAQDPATQASPDAVGAPLTFSIDGMNGTQGMDSALKIVLLMTVISLAPAFLILLTSFTRIVIVLGFLRQAIGANSAPGNQIIIGLALFLTIVVMSPTLTRVNQDAVQPFLQGNISQEDALKLGSVPLKEFMLAQVREKDIQLFLDMTGVETPDTPEELPMLVVVPSFVISELKTAFQMGFVLFIPFLIIDMVVASVLMSMGMMMLPPVLISLPFKILLFVLVDGWFLIVKSLVEAFH
ncbi:flagellar biosynthetic protein FliP [bacterium CG17_big_fil_post_rev_8_21_14_2_50_64_8]|nr:MAG: flagellar biosynthetic protein FliP [bacterium CG17_big_fil_post_rev_8_21_14_2_50_64_8]PJA75304.1 MAG: flagellar biosynthetic protein FliP [bacterium CG_4_9_14_3_um_filter_65_15]